MDPKMTQRMPTIMERFSWVCAPRITPITTAATNRISTARIANAFFCKARIKAQRDQAQNHHQIRDRGRGEQEQQGRGTHALLAVGVDEEDGEVDGLDDEPDAVDGDDEDAVGVHDGDAVEHPQHAVEQRREVGVRLELLHVPGLPDPPERRPVQAPEHKCRRRRRRRLSVSTNKTLTKLKPPS